MKLKFIMKSCCIIVVFVLGAYFQKEYRLVGMQPTPPIQGVKTLKTLKCMHFHSNQSPNALKVYKMLDIESNTKLILESQRFLLPQEIIKLKVIKMYPYYFEPIILHYYKMEETIEVFEKAWVNEDKNS